MKRIGTSLILTILLFFPVISLSWVCNNQQLKTPVIPLKQKQNLNFTNWADYISPELIHCFEKLSNIDIRLSYTTDDNMTRAKVMTGASGFAVIEQGALYLPDEIASHALLELDQTKLPNWRYRNRAIYHKIAESDDPGNRYGIVYAYGTTGIAYNQNAVDQAFDTSGKQHITPNSWAYLFDSQKLQKLSRCGVSLLDEPEQVFGNYFYYKGIDPNTTNKADYERAALYLIDHVRPYITYFDSNKYQNDFTAGNLCLVMGYSGDVVRSIARAKVINPKLQLHYVLPEQGTSLWFDMLMIPKGAKNLKAAYAFLNFNLEPYIAAMNSNYLYQPNAVEDNRQYLNPIFSNPNVNPTPAMIKKMYVLKIHPPEFQAFVSTLWMYVKYGIHFTPRYAKHLDNANEKHARSLQQACG